MRILGIDPGYAIVGCGIIEYDGRNFPHHRIWSHPTTPAGMDFFRGAFRDLRSAHGAHPVAVKPEAMAVEKLFFNLQPKDGHRRGPGPGARHRAGWQNRPRFPSYEYTPLQVKQAVVGYWPG